MSRPFLKMNGLGNDFVVVEARSKPFAPSVAEARAIADRASGVGCDQLIAIEASPTADAFMRIWNADGGAVEQCGNAARCVGWLLMEATGRDKARLDTPGGRFIETLATGHPRDRDSRIVSEPGFGQLTSRLWTLLRDESRKALDAA